MSVIFVKKGRVESCEGRSFLNRIAYVHCMYYCFNALTLGVLFKGALY